MKARISMPKTYLASLSPASSSAKIIEGRLRADTGYTGLESR
jgi:hypothetical protein